MDLKTRLGEKGELEIAAFLGATRTSDWYDPIKDMISIEGKTIEVKCQSRLYYNDTFTIRADKQTNLRKCLDVDRLIFLEYGIDPGRQNFYDWIRYYEVVDRHDFSIFTNSAGIMLGWRAASMSLLHEYYDPVVAAEYRKLSSTKYYKGD